MTEVKENDVKLLKLVTGEWVLCTLEPDTNDNGYTVMVDPYVYIISQQGAIEYCGIDANTDKRYRLLKNHIVTNTPPDPALAEQYVANVNKIKERRSGKPEVNLSVPPEKKIFLPD